MKTNQIKTGFIILLCLLGMGYTAKAQVYASGFNTISGNRVGIGTDEPFMKLDLRAGDFLFSSDTLSANRLQNWFRFSHQYWLDSSALILTPAVNPTGAIVSNTGWEFKYNGEFRSWGKIWAPEVEVRLPPFPDYVFDESYSLRSIGEVEEYINENGHLPGIPSAEEVEEEGIGLGEMQTLLLEKVEELTLYVIELKKENEKILKDNSALQVQLQALKK